MSDFARRRIALTLCAATFALAQGTSLAQAVGPEGGLDSRAWEMVSPLEKNGGEIHGPGGLDGGVLQASSGGGAVTFSSTASFGGAEGAAGVSQYRALRGGGGWSTTNLTPALLSGGYSQSPYQLFSPDLSSGLLSAGERCRDSGSDCFVPNPPLAPGAPAGYQNYYLRDALGGGYQALLTQANAPALALAPADFELALAGATADLQHVMLSTCAALTEGAVEVAAAQGCDPTMPNLYEWSGGTLKAINQGAPPATLAAPAGAISTDGSRVYWVDAGNLYLRDGSATKQVDAAQGGGGTFQTASADGSVAFFTKDEHLFRYTAADDTATDLTPGGEVVGVLGASQAGTYLYYLTAAGLFVWHEGTSAKVAAAADSVNFPPATGTARVTPDGTRLAFISSASLTGYNNAEKSEVFLYEAQLKRLVCVSCNPGSFAPKGPSSIPAAIEVAGGGLYKPRALTDDGTRVFFESSDALVLPDTGKSRDVYEWEAPGVGTPACKKVSGCVGLISNGRSSAGASFVDAGADGNDVFFLTGASLLPLDSDAVDLYDARVEGGFAEAPSTPPCEGDDCQGPAPEPEDPTPTTALFQGPVNPPVHFPKTRPKKHGKKHKKHGRRHHKRGAQRRGSR